MMSAEGTRPPGWGERLLAVACYFGFAPLVFLSRRRREPFLRHHLTRGLASGLLLIGLVLLVLLELVVGTYLLVNHPDVIDSLLGTPATILGYVLGGVVLVALLAWLAGVVLAALGSARDVPLVGRLARSRLGLRLAVAGNLAAWSFLLLVVGLTFHACSLVRDEGEEPVYVLCDKQRWERLIPHWAIKLASYRLALAAQRRWGAGSIVVAPLNEASLRQALRHGRIVVLWCHGSDGDVLTPDGWVSSRRPGILLGNDGRCVYLRALDGQVVPLEAGDDLQFVYCAACNAGRAAALWQRRLAPAEVVTFNRISGGLEHILWLWFDGPRRVAETR
jgi:uncharacterized membrane protein